MHTLIGAALVNPTVLRMGPNDVFHFPPVLHALLLHGRDMCARQGHVCGVYGVRGLG